MNDARRKYHSHKANAKRRGIEFEFTFEEWWAIWEPRFERRGRQVDQLMMCRHRDQGPYAPGNVRLDTPKGNGAERGMLHRARSHAEIQPKLLWKGASPGFVSGADWLNKRNPFKPYVEQEDD